MNVTWSAKLSSFLLKSFTQFSRKQVQAGRRHVYLWKKYPVLQRFGTCLVGVFSSAVSLAAFRPMLAFAKPERGLSPEKLVRNFKSIRRASFFACIDPIQLVLEQADALYDQVKYEEMLTLLMQYKDENNDEILWRLARALFEKSKLQASNDENVELLKQAKEYVYKSLSINEANFASHKWASILVVELAEHEGTKAKVMQSIVSKEHMMRAHALNPKDGTTLYLLGVWCFTFADLSWHQRKLAAVIFATPPSSSYEEALMYFKKAEEVEPNFYSMNLLMLGKSYLRLNNKEMARKYLKMASDYPQKTDEDKQANLEAVQLLKKLN